MTRIMNIPAAQEHRRRLRRDETFTERLLWRALRATRIDGVMFRRQFSVKQFVLDFYVPRVKLAIEVDGLSHTREGASVYDAHRQREIELLGIEFMRFTDEEVMRSVDRVAERIERRIREKLGMEREDKTP